MATDFTKLSGAALQQALVKYLSNQIQPAERFYLCYEAFGSDADLIDFSAIKSDLVENIMTIAERGHMEHFVQVATAIQDWKSWMPTLPYVRLAYLICRWFDIGEIGTLCFMLRVDPDNLVGEGKTHKAFSFAHLISRSDRGFIAKTKSELEKEKSHVDWSFLSLPIDRYIR